MMNKGRENDLTFLKPLLKFAKVIGITTTLKPSKFETLKIILTTIFVACFFSWAVYYKLKTIKNVLELYTDLLATSILAIFTIYSVLAFGFFKRRDFKEFTNELQTVNNILNTTLKRENRFSFYLEVIFSYLFMLSLIITALFTEVNDIGSLYHLFYKFYNNTFMVTLSLILRNYSVCLKFRFNKVIILLNNQKMRMKYIKVYLNLLKAVEYFNKLFEWQLFILSIRNLTWTVSIAQIFIYGALNNDLILGNIILNCIRGSLGWIMLFMVSLSCDQLTKEAKGILTINFYGFVKKDIRLISILKELIKDKVEISAAGFFTIDKSGLFALTGIVMSYIIVMIQLNKLEFK